MRGRRHCVKYDPRVPAPLMLIHIPKTAGTTLSQMLRLHFGLAPANWLRHARTLGYYHLGYARPEHMQARLERIASLAPSQQRQVRFFAAHAGFGLRDRLPEAIHQDAAYLTVLREPVARMISTFHHLRSEGRLPRDATLQQYVEQRKHFGLFKFDNCQTRYLAGDAGVAVDVPPGEVTRDMLDRARKRLEHELFWFGLTERFDESVLLLADAIGWARPRYVRARVTMSADRLEGIDESLMREMRELNDLDIELYEHAQRVLEARIRTKGDSFAPRVADFTQANARWARRFGPLVNAMPRARRLLFRSTPKR